MMTKLSKTPARTSGACSESVAVASRGNPKEKGKEDIQVVELTICSEKIMFLLIQEDFHKVEHRLAKAAKMIH
jgi:hypothetical protein